MSTGTLETIAEQLTSLNQNIQALVATGGIAAQQTAKVEPPAPATPDEEPPKAAKPAAKKVAAKKAPAKKAASKKEPDLSNLTVFKKQLFAVAESTGVEGVMLKLKGFIKSSGYGSSDEIEVDDRAEFLVSVQEHFETLKADEADEESESDLDL